MSKELEELLKEIQYKTDLSVEAIAKKIHYSREHVTKAKKSGKDVEPILEALKKEFGSIISQNVTQRQFDPNTMTAQALADIAASNKELAESNRKLTDELISYRNLSKNPIDDAARWTDFLGLLAEIGVSAKKWRSIEEADSALHKYSYGAVKTKKQMGKT